MLPTFLFLILCSYFGYDFRVLVAGINNTANAPAKIKLGVHLYDPQVKLPLVANTTANHC